MTKIQSDAEYIDQDFDSIDLKKALISQSEFQSCHFNRCDLSQSVGAGLSHLIFCHSRSITHLKQQLIYKYWES